MENSKGSMVEKHVSKYVGGSRCHKADELQAVDLIICAKSSSWYLHKLK